MTNLSQWFDLAQQNPWEVGVYEVQSKHQPQELGMYSFFDGHVFRYIKRDANSAFNYRADMTFAEIVRWRGLSTNPEVKKKPSGNRRVTKYAVMTSVSSIANHGQLLAVFSTEELAKKYADRESPAHFYPLEVHKIRFRTPE